MSAAGLEDAFGGARFSTILCDPPWYFKVWGKRGTGRGAFSHYNLMSDDELRALPVGQCAIGNGVNQALGVPFRDGCFHLD
jgi:N6-adenosine-specific RNA methylase IME4